MVYTDFDLFPQTALDTVSKLVGSTSTDRSSCEMLLCLICREIIPLIKLISQLYHWPEEALMDIFQVALPNNVYKISEVAWLSDVVSELM
jgi:hypothetical protein